jgi:hypothetical protein
MSQDNTGQRKIQEAADGIRTRDLSKEIQYEPWCVLPKFLPFHVCAWLLLQSGAQLLDIITTNNL